jgi:hypothetical protein
MTFRTRRSRWIASIIGLTMILVISSAALSQSHGQTIAQDEHAEVTLEPGSEISVYCETELRASENNGVYHLSCEPLPEPEPEPTPEPEEPEEPTDPDAPLLSGFSFTVGAEERFAYIESGFASGLQQGAPFGTRTVVDPGQYAGWDVLLTDQGSAGSDPVRFLSTNQWITLHLNRPATVAIVWQANEPLPAWLSGWDHQGTPVVIRDSVADTPRQVLQRTFDAGEVVLGGVYANGESGGQRSPYYVVLQETEAGNVDPGPDPTPDPTPEPTPEPDPTPDPGDGHDHDHDPDIDDVHHWLNVRHHWPVEPLSVVNVSELEQPVQGQECPRWVSNRYVTQAPDGDWYRTWHPTIDEEYGCYFGYEHGSNPGWINGAYSPPFGYGEPDHIRESFYGYKVHAMYAENNIQVLATTHFGTAEPHLAVCQRYHWNNFQFIQNGELVASIYIMGDFGAALHNDTNQPLTHPGCEDQRTGEMKTQAQVLQESHGVRLNPVCTGPNRTDCGTFYYPWRMTSPGAREVLGFNSRAYTVNTPPVVSSCADMNCLESHHVGGHGAWRLISFASGFGVTDPGHSADGVFYTNPFGDELRNPDDPDAIRQYVRPGTNISLTHISDNHAYFPDARYGDGLRGNFVYTQLPISDRNIAHGHRGAVDPENYIGRLN